MAFISEIEMSVIREFSCFDLFKFNKVNLDPLTETYGLTFYMTYQAKWPEYFYTAESPNGEIQGYIMGKAEVLIIFVEGIHKYISRAMMTESNGMVT